MGRSVLGAAISTEDRVEGQPEADGATVTMGRHRGSADGIDQETSRRRMAQRDFGL